MADIQSIIDRAASAATLAEECDVIRDLLFRDSMENIFPHVSSGHVLSLRNIVSNVACQLSPRSALLGVVASLSTDDLQWSASKWADEGVYGGAVISRAGGAIEADAETPALALLIAICRSLQAQGSASHD